MACHGKGIQDCLHLRWIGQQVILYPLNINWLGLNRSLPSITL